MTPKHFISILIDTYEAAYSAIQAGAVQSANLATVIETAIQAATAVATNRWDAQEDRARLIAAALLRARFGATAAAEAADLGPAIAFTLALGAADPPTREEIAALAATPPQPSGDPPPLGPP